MSVVPASSLIESSIAYPLVIGCSIFSIGWGIINIIMVRKVDMNDNTRIKKAPSDTEQPLVQKDSVSDAEFCLSEMKKISQLIETGAITFLK
jgi:Na+/H+-translocating membrane pyrophosphatase